MGWGSSKAGEEVGITIINQGHMHLLDGCKNGRLCGILCGVKMMQVGELLATKAHKTAEIFYIPGSGGGWVWIGGCPVSVRVTLDNRVEAFLMLFSKRISWRWCCATDLPFLCLHCLFHLTLITDAVLRSKFRTQAGIVKF